MPVASLIPHSRPTMPEGSEWEEVTREMVSGWAADGPVTRRFEEEAAGVLGHAWGVAVNSGSSALQLALQALDVAGGEVIVPAYCCAAVLNAVVLAGAEPVPVDCSLKTFAVDPGAAAAACTPRTKAVVVAHMFGVVAPLEPFLELGLPVVEDCAQSLGAGPPARPAGSRGRIAIGSFFATKVLSTGHGGIVATSDPALAERVRDLTEYDNRPEWSPRQNLRFTELQAALGLWQLRRLPEFIRRRREIAASYDAQFRPSGVVAVPPAADEDYLPFRYVLRAEDADRAFAVLRERGIDAKRPVYQPLTRYMGGSAPRAEQCHRELVSVPIYPTLADEDVRRVASSWEGAARDLANP